jgi:hypothetical protein
MSRLRNVLSSLRWRLTLIRWEIETRAAGLLALIAVAAFIAAILVSPDWALRFSRVLAWPVIALLAIVAFRQPLSQLIHGQALSRVAAGPLSLELQQREEEFDPALVTPPADESLTSEYVLHFLGTLAQVYQVQIDFLKHLHQAENGLTTEATHTWFRAALDRNPVTIGWDADPLLQWLIDRALLTLREDGRYVFGALGSGFLGALEGFWYAPKLI